LERQELIFLKTLLAIPTILLVETAFLLMFLLNTNFLSAIQASPFVLGLAIMALIEEANSFI
jgi:hypothetical protein